ncbi:hypothetical protein EX30DRAFT_370660 [Ascodesmis nigricans]|uniref:Protein ROT1 n=1 Tax=Ascodesmis nigricans TaxID=341454 RepID=A0A4S2N0Y2_9PEZI|nr:hypothetical protein EX30DRAFT_370660 [Ascodesmis nigricans]
MAGWAGNGVVVQARESEELSYAMELVGTWASKSGTVLTGPDFFDYEHERLLEPRLPGISYSFTSDGFFEEAQYIILPEPANPSCPRALLQFQHGRYTLHSNLSLVLHPIATDGRQLLSDPCLYKTSIYTRFNATSVMKGWEVKLDTYRDKMRLQMYQFDGTPVNPLWLVDKDPKKRMLPTDVLRPVEEEGKEGKERRRMVKRRLVERVEGRGWGLKGAGEVQPERWLWVGVGLTVAGAVGLFCV